MPGRLIFPTHLHPSTEGPAIGGIQSMAHRLWVRHLIDLSNGHTKTLQKIDIEITEVIIFFEGVEGVSRS